MTYGLRLLDGALVEACDECGFDSRQVADEAAAASSAFSTLARLQTTEMAAERPQPDVWSGVEYTEHVIQGVNTVLQHVQRALGAGDLSPVETIEEASAAMAACFAQVTLSERRLACPFMGVPTDVGGVLLHFLHDLEHHVLDVRRGLAGFALLQGSEVVTVER